MVIARFVKTGRAVITVLFALFVGLILMTLVFLIAESLGLRSQPTAEEQCQNDWEREHLRQLALDAIDDAFKKHVGQLFEIWVKDPSDQPRRATGGMAINISAYKRARANTIKWDPPRC